MIKGYNEYEEEPLAEKGKKKTHHWNHFIKHHYLYLKKRVDEITQFNTKANRQEKSQKQAEE